MKGFFYILLFYLAGVGISRLLGNFMPGSVIGMMLFFGALMSKIVKGEDVRGAAMFFLDNMGLFFVPVGVGLMVSYPMIREHLLTIAVTVVVCTTLVIVSVGFIQQKLERRRKR